VYGTLGEFDLTAAGGRSEDVAQGVAKEGNSLKIASKIRLVGFPSAFRIIIYLLTLTPVLASACS
jgi:hypothetical protein